MMPQALKNNAVISKSNVGDVLHLRTDDDAASVAMSLQNVTKIYPDGTCSLRDISFDLKAGSLVAVVGPSGCGKSTLLRLASGLEDCSSGQLVGDRHKMGYVFQDANLLPWRSVIKNIELFAELHGASKTERHSMALQAIQLVGLQGFENHYPKSLSGGMRMRVSLARTLVLNPQIYLFDEPFAALDEISRERLHDELLRLYQQVGFTGLFITHSIQEAVYLANRVLVMSERPGRIVADIDVPMAYPRTPQTRFSREFNTTCLQVQQALKGFYA